MSLNPSVMIHPVAAVVAILLTLIATAFVMPTRYQARSTLVVSALVMGGGVVVATACAWWNGRLVPRSDLLVQTSLASALLITFAMTPPLGGRFCRSSAAVVCGALILAAAMVVSEFV
jgi:hypothetical protein